MAYEYNLRGLFRPQIDRLPLSGQLIHYHQRDLTASHLYRLGASLFRGSGITTRRRLIDATLYSSTALSPHTALFSRSLDDRSLTGYKSSHNSKDHNTNNSTSISLPTLCKSEKVDICSSSHSQFTKCEYQKWIADRQRMRGSLEGLDALKHWLLSKEQTPMENSLLTSMCARKVSDEMLITKESKVIKCYWSCSQTPSSRIS